MHQNKALILSHMEGQKRTWTDSREVTPSSESSIRVFVRVRPLHVGSGDPNPELFSVVETQAPRTLHVSQLSLQALYARVATRTFEADGVLAPDASNEALWDKVGMDDVLLRGAKGDENMFYLCAYGQTGSGKTFSTTYLERMSNHLHIIHSTDTITQKGFVARSSIMPS
jgi:kinesin family protein 2/24